MCSLAGRILDFGPLGHGEVVDNHWHVHKLMHSISKCNIESIVYPASLRTAQEKFHETLCLLKRSARLCPDLKWIHLSTSWPDLTWMSRSLAREASCSLAFSSSFRVLPLLLSHPAPWTGGVRAPVLLCVYAEVCCFTYEKGCGRLFLFSNILHCVWRVVLEQQEQKLNNFPNGYLWPSENMSYRCLSHTQIKACHCSSTAFTASQCHTQEKKRVVVENLHLMYISCHYITKQTRYTLTLALMSDALKDTVEISYKADFL